MNNRKKIAIVGVGLIGGSMALQLHEKKLSSRLIGVEASAQHAEQALEYELVDEVLPLDEAIIAADVIVLAVPVNVQVNLLPQILDKVTDQIVMDMGSTKSDLIAAVQNHPRRGRYVASHPMWGTEYSGPAAAVRGAFEGKAVIICNRSESDADAVEWVEKMYQKIGMRVTDMDARAHDLHVAYVSHISHITSFALANTVLEKEKVESAIFQIASAGFESTVRLAKSNPAMWVPIFLQNKENILDVLSEHIDQLTKFKDYIANSDQENLQSLIADANKIKRIIK
ncbi:prephenate dehydrogenase [Niabella yanshanensis]|uniref:Prephenate dehydrogenase n=1 Tax=Niabella yanshanensis TaxID=577386 RepID=A0ABZ0WCU3_9BACT|nr:prephenate dehydrogenase [Niabella yanshanensis]WQD39827.1 prephenate dehydrogenase [Niabella yanshanensis]